MWKMKVNGIRTLLRYFWTLPIVVYQKVISPLFPSSCIYYPSCSHYGREAIMRFGILKGGLFASARILRCHGAYTGGFDPVPQAFSFRRIRVNHEIYRRRRSPRTKVVKQ